MEEKDNEKFGSIRVKNGTIAEFKRLKIATENSFGHEFTNDEFVRFLLNLALK